MKAPQTKNRIKPAVLDGPFRLAFGRAQERVGDFATVRELDPDDIFAQPTSHSFGIEKSSAQEYGRRPKIVIYLHGLTQSAAAASHQANRLFGRVENGGSSCLCIAPPFFQIPGERREIGAPVARRPFVEGRLQDRQRDNEHSPFDEVCFFQLPPGSGTEIGKLHELLRGGQADTPGEKIQNGKVERAKHGRG